MLRSPVPSKDTNYTTIPKDLFGISNGRLFAHITTNETIAGTQWHNIPYNCGVPLVADMSSDILSRTSILISLILSMLVLKKIWVPLVSTWLS
jgi:phosphoserine aminotransferase